jgi:hypothetical protein
MSTIKANTLLHSDGTTTNPPAIPALDKRMAKAWVNFIGQGTVAINSAYNVSSITDNGTGDYTLNFTVNMANVNYSMAGMAGANNTSLRSVGQAFSVTAPTVSAVRLQVAIVDASLADAQRVHAVIFSS